MQYKDQKRYMELVDNVLKKATIANKKQILEIIKSDFLKHLITEDTYINAQEKVQTFFNRLNEDNDKILFDEGER